MDIKIIFTRWPFRRKLLLFLLVIFLPAFGSIIATGVSQRQHAIAKAQDDAQLLVRSLAAQQEQIAIATETMLSTLAQLPEVQNLKAPACNRIFHELHKQYPFYSSILAMTPDGYVFAAHPPLEHAKVNQSDRKYFQDAVRSLDFSAGEYIIGRVSKMTSLNYSFPVLDAHKKVVAVLSAGLSLNKLGDFISTAKLPEGSAVVFTDHKGVRLYRLPEHEAAPNGKPVLKGYLDSITGSGAEGMFEWMATDGVKRINAFKQLRLRENSPPYMYMVVGLPKDMILHKANLNMLRNLLILGLAALLALSLAWMLGNEVLIKPINRLVAATQQFGRGDMDTRTGLPHTPDELGRLAQSFDSMASLLEMRNREREKAKQELTKAYDELEGRVQERTAELATTNADLQVEISERKQAEEEIKTAYEYLENIFANSADGIGIVDEHGNFQRWNKAAEEIYGYAFKELRGKPAADLYADKSEHQKMLQILRRDGFVRNYEVTMKRKDGSMIACSLSIQMLHGVDNKIIGSVAVSRDLTTMKQTLAEVQVINGKLQIMVNEAEQRHREATLINDMVESLQSCISVEEAYPIIAHCAQQLFEFCSGALFMVDPASNLLEAVTLWGNNPVGEQVYSPDDCWAIRRGRVYLSGSSFQENRCRHLPNNGPGGYLCIPLMAQGETAGLLHIQCAGEVEASVIDRAKDVSVTIGDNISLALANIKLRETLRHQVMHDSLTGLFNRRYLAETLKREIARVLRKKASLGIIMMDLDYFKRFNDTYGHEAGDRLLESLGKFLETQLRKEDLACRYGGEEFVLILPEASLDVTQKRAEQIRQGVSQLQVSHRGRVLGLITVSLGIAMFPEHGATGEDVLRAADDAMYKGKALGGNRVVVAESGLPLSNKADEVHETSSFGQSLKIESYLPLSKPLKNSKELEI